MAPRLILGAEQHESENSLLYVTKVIPGICEEGVKFQWILGIIIVIIQCNKYFNKDKIGNHWKS